MSTTLNGTPVQQPTRFEEPHQDRRILSASEEIKPGRLLRSTLVQQKLNEPEFEAAFLKSLPQKVENYNVEDLLEMQAEWRVQADRVAILVEREATARFQRNALAFLEKIAFACEGMPGPKPKPKAIPVAVRKRKRIAAAAIAIAEGCNSYRAIARPIGIASASVRRTPEIVEMLDAAGGLMPEVDSDAAEDFDFENHR